MLRAISGLGLVFVAVFLERDSILTEVLFIFFFILMIIEIMLDKPYSNKDTDLLTWNMFYSHEKDEYRH